MPGCRQSRRPPASAPERTPPACRTRYCASVDSNASAAARHVRATLLHAPPEVNVCATCHAWGGTDMKSLGRCVGVLSVLLLAHVYAAAPARSSISAAGRAALSQHLSAAVQRGDVPGVVALVVDRERVLYQGAAGKLDVARGVDMPADALFRMASMTKPVTSVAAMMLVEAGRLGLGDPS